MSKNNNEKVSQRFSECPRQAKGNGRIPKNPDVPKNINKSKND